jgi:hypothetical protein
VVALVALTQRVQVLLALQILVLVAAVVVVMLLQLIHRQAQAAPVSSS